MDCARRIPGPYINRCRRCGGQRFTRSQQEMMLDGLRQFIADVVSPGAHEHRAFDDTGYRLAATALLVHVVSLDGEPSETEKRKLHSLIESRFGLDQGMADQLIKSAMLVEG